ncbi:hypothetical protein DFH08DRAFT_817101 [Mycena albidolilacea]|uniref:Uncharacterized protein n=1 Tax=Mycena albidolilacea TaxID=1033008 RepID=A0AAD6ZIU8_9AGAR|nr:hypothetical protein DFH08DRAFT_817101 [Mycena albidolilacea]
MARVVGVGGHLIIGIGIPQPQELCRGFKRRMWPTRPASIGDPSERNPLWVAQIGASGSRAGGWGCVPRTQEEEPDSGVEIPRQRTESRGSGVVEAREEQSKTRTTRWGQEHSRLKSQNQAIQPKRHQGVMNVKEPTGGARGTPVAIQECPSWHGYQE